jgi:hypothetical protein
MENGLELWIGPGLVLQSRPAQTDSVWHAFWQSIGSDCAATKWSFLSNHPVPPAPPGLRAQPLQHCLHVRHPCHPYPLQAFIEKQRLLPPLFTPHEPLLAPPRARCSYRLRVTVLRAPLLMCLESMGVTTELCEPQANIEPPRGPRQSAPSAIFPNLRVPHRRLLVSGDHRPHRLRQDLRSSSTYAVPLPRRPSWAPTPPASLASCSHLLRADTLPSFTITPQCSTSLPAIPKTAGQPPSSACPFRQGSPSWTTLVSFFQSRFRPQIDSLHAKAAQAANHHSLAVGHQQNRPGAAVAQCRRPRLPCNLAVGCQPRLSQRMCWARLETGQTLAQGAQWTFIFSSDLMWIIQIESKHLENCSNSSKFEKNINLIPLFEF